MSAKEPSPPGLDDAALILLAKQTRGMTSAKIRFIGAAPETEGAIIHALMALGISVESEHIADLAPAPQRRFSFRYDGSTALITVAFDVPADHY